jgi:fused signal recognition particle receptor
MALGFFRRKKQKEEEPPGTVADAGQTGSAEAPIEELKASLAPQGPQDGRGFDAQETWEPQKAEPPSEHPSEHPEDRQGEKKKGFFARFRKKEATKVSEEPPREEPEEEPKEESIDEIPETAAVEQVEEEVERAEPGEDQPPPEEEKQSFFQRLRDRLSKTRKAFTDRVDRLLFGKKEIDEELLEELEEILITSDIGVHTAMALIEEVRQQVVRKDLKNPEELKHALQNRILQFLSVPNSPETVPTGKPHVIMVVGVNGVGKTTTIGKLAARFTAQGKRVLLVAGDTFRAAAVEQLEIWAQRVGVEIVRHKGKADPSAVAFDGIQAAVSRGADIVIIDTAGRLHTKINLMEELKKMRRTVGKQLAGAPHETLLVLDATTGQNAISQAQLFHEAIEISGIVLTKLDGTAKGGVVVGICHSLGVPLAYIGIGEKVDDLQPFDPDGFMKALF